MSGKEKGEGRRHDEEQILGRDRRQNVIFSKQNVIVVKWKSMDCKPPNSQTTERTL